MRVVLLRLPQTGLTGATLQFKLSSGGGFVTGLSVAEIGGTSYNYVVTGFTAAIAEHDLWVNGSLQTYWINQEIGVPSLSYVMLSGNQTGIAGDKSFTGDNNHAGINTFAGSLVANGNTYLLGNIMANISMNGCKLTGLANGTANGDSVKFEQLMLLPNSLIVNSQATAVTGKLYNSIAAAMTYAHAQAQAFNIYVYENAAGYYEENFTWYDTINIIGMGAVVVKNTPGYSTFVRTGFTSKVKCENIHFENTDQNLLFKAMLVRNSSVYMFEDLNPGTIELENSQFEQTNFSHNSSGAFTSNDNNRIIGCTASQDVVWQASDKVYGFVVIAGDYYVTG